RLLKELGDQKIPFLGPSDRGFQQLWDSSYSGLVLRRSCSLPAELHAQVQAALLTLRKKGCLLRDLVRVRDRDVFTNVSRALLGDQGHTYRYLDTRLFAIPWHNEDAEVKGQNCCDADLRAACKALWELNNFFCSDVAKLKEGDRLAHCAKGETETKQAEQGETESKHSEDSKNSEGGDSESQKRFNVTLLNYMDPPAMTQLKEEPYYGMGKMAVGWHHDENLITHSPVAVYSYSCHDDKVLKENDNGFVHRRHNIFYAPFVVGWPILDLPVHRGDCYSSADDLNSTHQHCVLAGDTARFSSTHRMAECSNGTLTYIQSKCQEALSNLHTDPETGFHSLLALLPTTLQRCEEIHNEVEFEWLRQYWFQGQRYTRFCSWWTKPMEQLEKDWKLMEMMVSF
uniref:Alpha-ketoglutarate-dependent dioxygenase FTO n=1 Tax=Tetraodon nigroviridis TaxID=99883 RepID=H3D7X0_TETNG